MFTGRTRPGYCYRLCREADFLALPRNTPPELQRTDLSLAVLQLKAMDASIGRFLLEYERARIDVKYKPQAP
jgi:HrpA-like RNA helicase